MAKRGPKRIELDWDQVDKLCLIQCTLDEIAFFFSCSPDTIENRCNQDKGVKFSEYYKRKAAAGKISLRRAMFRKAIEQDNCVMQIWLSKQYLGMRDQVDQTITDDSKQKQTVINVNVEELTRIAQTTPATKVSRSGDNASRCN